MTNRLRPFMALLVSILVCSTPALAAGKSGGITKLWNKIFGGDDFLSQSEYYSIVGGGRVLCANPAEDGSCESALVYTTLGSKTAKFFWDGRMLGRRILRISSREVWNGKRICPPARYDASNTTLMHYEGAAASGSTRMRADPMLLHYFEDAERKRVFDQLNVEILGYCYGYKRASSEGSNVTLIETEFYEGVEQSETTVITVLPKGSEPILR